MAFINLIHSLEQHGRKLLPVLTRFGMLLADQGQPAHEDILDLPFAEGLILAKDIQETVHPGQDVAILR